MAIRDLTTMGRDLVMKTLDGLASRVGEIDAAPDSVRQIAEKWGSMSQSDRDDFAGRIAVAVEGALAVVPIAAVAASKRVRRAVKRQVAPAAADVTDAADTDKKKKKKDKKNKKKDKKKKNKKNKKNKKKKKSKRK